MVIGKLELDIFGHVESNSRGNELWCIKDRALTTVNLQQLIGGKSTVLVVVDGLKWNMMTWGSSSHFWWHWQGGSDGRHLGFRSVCSFTIRVVEKWSYDQVWFGFRSGLVNPISFSLSPKLLNKFFVLSLIQIKLIPDPSIEINSNNTAIELCLSYLNFVSWQV